LKTAVFYIGRALQLLGMGTVFIAFINFFTDAPMGMLIKITVVGAVEFYTGSFIVSWAGVKKEPGEGGAK